MADVLGGIPIGGKGKRAGMVRIWGDYLRDIICRDAWGELAQRVLVEIPDAKVRRLNDGKFLTPDYRFSCDSMKGREYRGRVGDDDEPLHIADAWYLVLESDQFDEIDAKCPHYKSHPMVEIK